MAFGLSRAKKPGQSKPPPTKRRAVFGGDDSDDEGSGRKDNNNNSTTSAVLEIGGLDDFGTLAAPTHDEEESKKNRPRPSKGGPPSQPPKLKSKAQPSAMFGDLSSTLTARKNAKAAEELDPSVYDYDAVYDSLKPEKNVPDEAGAERRSRYMKSVIESAEVRKRDQLIASEKKIAREREAEGDEYEEKEKFVTEAYKKQQEENRRIEEEEKRKEEEEARKNKVGGMSAFYRNMLDRGEQRHSQAVKAAEEAAKEGPKQSGNPAEDITPEQLEAKRVKELNEKGASIVVNEDGQVVDKRQLLRAGLNISAKASTGSTQRETAANASTKGDRRQMGGAQIGSKQSMRERQSRMLAEQLEQSTKRSRENAEMQREETERAAKSHKTEGDISSARERYLARKKAAEEEKKAGNA